MPVDREEAAIVDNPGAVADDMADATQRLRDNAWMVAPLTSGAVTEPDQLTAEPALSDNTLR